MIKEHAVGKYGYKYLQVQEFRVTNLSSQATVVNNRSDMLLIGGLLFFVFLGVLITKRIAAGLGA